MFTEEEVLKRIMKLVKHDEKGCWIWTGYMLRGTCPQYSGTKSKHSINRSVRKVLYKRFKDTEALALPKKGMGLRSNCGEIRCVRPTHCEPTGKKFSVRDIKNIRKEIANGTSMTKLAKLYQCSVQNISIIGKRQTFDYA